MQRFDVAPNPDAGECGCVLGFDPASDGGLEVVCCDPGQRCCGTERNCDVDAACPPGFDWGIHCEWDWCSSDGCRCREHCCTCTAAECGGNCACLVSWDNLTLAECERCQGAPCGSDAECDERFPCSGGSIEIRGCCEDSECAGLAPYCGQANGAHNVCVRNDCN